MTFDAEELTVKVFVTEKQEARIIDLDEYVIGAVASSIPPEFPQEALKAQAICCRTLAVKRMGIFGGTGCKRQPGFDICTDPVLCQGFMDIEDRQKAWANRYEEFTNKIRSSKRNFRNSYVYNNNPIEAVYHEACGGCTEDSKMFGATK